MVVAEDDPNSLICRETLSGVANQAVFVLLCIEAGLLSGHGVDGHLDYHRRFELWLGERIGSLCILGGDNLQRPPLFPGRFNHAGLSKPDHALVAHVPIAGVKGRYGFGQDVELETDFRVFVDQFGLPALHRPMKIKGIVPVAEAKRNDIGGVPVEHAQATYGGLADDGFDSLFIHSGDALLFNAAMEALNAGFPQYGLCPWLLRQG